MSEDTQKPVELSKEDIEKFQLIEAPIFYASQFHAQVTSQDVQLILQRTLPGQVNGSFGAAKIETVAAITLSLHALKDLSLMLAGLVEQVEKECGPLVTEFSKKRQS